MTNLIHFDLSNRMIANKKGSNQRRSYSVQNNESCVNKKKTTRKNSGMHSGFQVDDAFRLDTDKVSCGALSPSRSSSLLCLTLSYSVFTFRFHIFRILQRTKDATRIHGSIRLLCEGFDRLVPGTCTWYLACTWFVCIKIFQNLQQFSLIFVCSIFCQISDVIKHLPILVHQY